MTTTLQDTLVLEELAIPGYERVIKVTDEAARLLACIAIHDRRLCKASLGGTRILAYASFDDALRDCLRLAKGMTYKSAVSESGWGGAKSVIMLAKGQKKTPKMLHAFAEALNRLEGIYICAEDVGTTPEDIAMVAQKTPYAVGLPNEKSSGNPAYYTAWGVFRGIQAALKHLFNNPAVEGRTVAIQGVGAVGERVAELLFWHGAKLILADINQEKAHHLAHQYGAKVVAPDEIYSQACDIFAPCALGAIINPKTIAQLRCLAVAGSANNQLLTEEDGERLMRAGILYAPDFVINAGGLINVTAETMPYGYRPCEARNKTDKIFDQLMLIFDIATQNKISTEAAAMRLGDYRLRYGVGKRVDPIYMHHANMSY